MAKQQRMAVLTAACVAGAAEHLLTGTQYVLLAAAVIIAAGSAVTCIVRARLGYPAEWRLACGCPPS